MDIHFVVPDTPAAVKSSKLNDNEWSLKLDQLVKFEQGSRSKKDFKVSGEVNFGFDLAVVRSNKNGVDTWSMEVGLADEAIVTNFKCDLEADKCDAMVKFFKNDMASHLFSFADEKISPFDLPLALNQLVGLLEHFKDFQSQAENQVHVEVKDDSIGLFMNCKADNVQHALD